MFAIVWLLPVPGGPSITNDRPASAAAIAARCDESASRIAGVSSGAALVSISSSAISSKTKPVPAAAAGPPAAMALTAGCAAARSSWPSRSRYIASLANEKHDRMTLSLTCQPSLAATATRTASSSPASVTSSRSSTRGRLIPYWDSFRLSAGLTTGSSSVGSSTGNCRGLAATSRAGTSSSGLV